MISNHGTEIIPSEIQSFYSGKTIFITGASGFLGKLLVEKLLRSCEGVKRIYILLREKKGKSPHQRIDEIYDIPAFEILKREKPDFLSKISPLEGDLILPNLGLSDAHQILIKEEVDCIFHIAASVRFDERIRKAAYVNVRSVRDLLRIAKDTKRLKSFVHVSTAFSNCIHQHIEEVFYEPVITGKSLLELVELLDDDVLDAMTPALLRANPNTYVLTKCIAEDVVKVESENLPVAIVRPSIVISTYKEPISGWIDSLYGPTIIVIAAGQGLLRTIHGKAKNVADLVPADFVINATIVAAWNVADSGLTQNQNIGGPKSAVAIFNYVSRQQNPITWSQYEKLSKEFGSKIPSPLIIWYSTFNFHSNYYVHFSIALLFQTVPAYIIDFVANCIGKKPMIVEALKKIDKFCAVISYFTMREWDFSNANTQSLWKKLNPTDKKLYNFDMTSMTWSDFFSTYLVGSRVYLMNDPLSTIPQGRRKVIAVKIGHYLIITTLCLLFYKLISMLYGLCL